MGNPILLSGIASPQSIYDELIVAKAGGNQNRAEGHHPVGTRAILEDGRVFYYCSNGATALTPSTLLMVPATTGLNRSADHDKIILTDSSASFAAGNRKPVLQSTDLDTSDIIANEYKDGYLSFQDVTGEGQYFKIKGHDGLDASSTTTSATIELYDPIKVSAGNTTQISFARNRHDRVIASSTNEEETPIGVSPSFTVTASTALATDVTTTAASTNTTFFWAQTWGPCTVQMTGTTIASGVAFTSGTSAKMITEWLQAANNSMLQIGVGLQTAGAASDFVMVDLRICA